MNKKRKLIGTQYNIEEPLYCLCHFKDPKDFSGGSLVMFDPFYKKQLLIINLHQLH